MAEFTKPQARPRAKLLLIVSLALNLIIVGLIVGAIFGGNYRGKRDALPPPGVRGYLSAMTNEQRREFRRDSNQGFLGHLKVIKDLHKDQTDILEAIEAEKFDQTTVLAAMTKQRDTLSSVMAGFHGELVKALAGLSHAERTRFVERFNNGVRMKRDKHRPDRHKP